MDRAFPQTARWSVVHIDTSVADHWIRTGALADSWVLAVAGGDDRSGRPARPEAPTPAARDRVVAAREAVLALVDPYLPARPDLWDAVLPGWPGALEDSRVMLVVGWPAPFDAGVRTDPQGRAVIVLDVARLTAYPPQDATGAAQQLLDHELTHEVVRGRWPLPAGAGCADRLDHVAFDEGLAHHLSLGTIAAVAPDAPGRAERQAEALRTLADALVAVDESERAAFFDRADAADGFWEKYACVAGMLAFGDAEHAAGAAGVRALLDRGWHGFAARAISEVDAA